MSTVDAAGNTVQQVGTIIHNAQGQPQFIAVSSCGPTHVMVGTPTSVATQGGNAVATVLGTAGPRVVAVQQPQQFVATGADGERKKNNNNSVCTSTRGREGARGGGDGKKEMAFTLFSLFSGKSGANTPSSGVALLGNSSASGVATVQVAQPFLQQVCSARRAIGLPGGLGDIHIDFPLP